MMQVGETTIPLSLPEKVSELKPGDSVIVHMIVESVDMADDCFPVRCRDAAGRWSIQPHSFDLTIPTRGIKGLDWKGWQRSTLKLSPVPAHRRLSVNDNPLQAKEDRASTFWSGVIVLFCGLGLITFGYYLPNIIHWFH